MKKKHFLQYRLLQLLSILCKYYIFLDRACSEVLQAVEDLGK